MEGYGQTLKPPYEKIGEARIQHGRNGLYNDDDDDDGDDDDDDDDDNDDDDTLCDVSL